MCYIHYLLSYCVVFLNDEEKIHAHFFLNDHYHVTSHIHIRIIFTYFCVVDGFFCCRISQDKNCEFSKQNDEKKTTKKNEIKNSRKLCNEIRVCYFFCIFLSNNFFVFFLSNKSRSFIVIIFFYLYI